LLKNIQNKQKKKQNNFSQPIEFSFKTKTIGLSGIHEGTGAKLIYSSNLQIDKYVWIKIDWLVIF